MIEKRVLSAADEPAFYDLAQYAFNKPDSEQRQLFFQKLYRNSVGFGVFDQGHLKSSLLATPFEVNFKGQTFKMSGIGYVASYPEFSGQGGISDLMHLAFERMQADGITLSYLAPFSYPFYRRFGYEQVFEQTCYQIKTADLPRLKFAPDQGRVERLSLSAAVPLISAFQQRHPHNQVGGIQRDAWWWQYNCLKHPDWEVAVYTNGDQQVAGYVIYSRQATTLEIQELLISTVASQEQLVKFIFKHQSAYQTIRYESGLTTSLGDLLPDPTIVETTTIPYMMARIVSLADFLARYPYEVLDLEAIKIAVSDDFLPENSGVWQLSLHAGQPMVTKLASQRADITVTIQQLTKAMMGYRTLASQAYYGQVNGDADKITRLSAAFNQTQPMLWDYF